MTILLTLSAVALGLFIIGQVMRVFELSSNLRGRAFHEVTEKDGKVNAVLMLVFMAAYFIFVIWQVAKWGKFALPVSASEHGVTIDNLMATSWWIIVPVFVLTHVLLFWYGYKYVYDKNRRADYFPHSNKLELIWTVVPTVVLTALILYGLNVWNNVMTPLTDDVDHIRMELYARQFDWTARYSGDDNKLGYANVNFIEGTNSVGMDARDETGHDDIIVKGEFHLPVNVPVQFIMRSQDVIHSAYMPHFRAQMNCVPGVKTRFQYTPTITTAEMRKITNNPDFDYILLCNKICGAAHYNMQMNIIVESEEDYRKWMSEQKPFIEGNAAPEEMAEATTPEATPAVEEAEETEVEETVDAKEAAAEEKAEN